MNVVIDSIILIGMNDNHVTQARAELDTALNDATLVDDLPHDEANSYEGRRAKWRARVALEAAQVHATLALVEAYTVTVAPRPITSSRTSSAVGPTLRHDWTAPDGTLIGFTESTPGLVTIELDVWQELLTALGYKAAS